MNVSAFDIRDRYETLIESSTVYSYIGTLQEKDFNDVLKSMEQFIEKHVEAKLMKKKMFHILIEITQNLHNYNKEKDGKAIEDHLFFLVKELREGYRVITGNYLLKKEIPGIRTRIDMVNTMTDKELKELYRGILNFGGVSNGGGAGLGFVDLARRSGEKLIYKFEEIDDKFSFFTLEVNVTN
ncbi:MAG: SiaB family protein kinase [Fulvivirga sp.]